MVCDADHGRFRADRIRAEAGRVAEPKKRLPLLLFVLEFKISLALLKLLALLLRPKFELAEDAGGAGTAPFAPKTRCCWKFETGTLRTCDGTVADAGRAG